MKVYDNEKYNEFEIKKFDWIFGVLGIIPIVRIGRAFIANAFGIGSYFITLVFSWGINIPLAIFVEKIEKGENGVAVLMVIVLTFIGVVVQGFLFSALRVKNVLNNLERFTIMEE